MILNAEKDIIYDKALKISARINARLLKKIYILGDKKRISLFSEYWKNYSSVALTVIDLKKSELFFPRLKQFLPEEEAVILCSARMELKLFCKINQINPKLAVFTVFSDRETVALYSILFRMALILKERLLPEKIKKVALYGAGKHSEILIEVFKKLRLAKIVKVIQTTKPSATLFGDIPLVAASQFNPEEVDAIILSSQSYEHEMFRFCLQNWPQLPVFTIWEQRLQHPYFLLKNILNQAKLFFERNGVRSVTFSGSLKILKLSYTLWQKMNGQQVKAFFSEETIEKKSEIYGIPVYSGEFSEKTDGIILLEKISNDDHLDGTIVDFRSILKNWHDAGNIFCSRKNFQIEKINIEESFNQPAEKVLKEEWEKILQKKPFLTKKIELVIVVDRSDADHLAAIMKKQVENNDFDWTLRVLISDSIDIAFWRELPESPEQTERISFVKVNSVEGKEEELIKIFQKSQADYLLLFSSLLDFDFSLLRTEIEKYSPDCGKDVILLERGGEEFEEKKIILNRMLKELIDQDLVAEFSPQLIVFRNQAFRRIRLINQSGYGLFIDLLQSLRDNFSATEIEFLKNDTIAVKKISGSICSFLIKNEFRIELETVFFPLNVAFDARLLSRKMTGTERYISELLRSVARIALKVNLKLTVLARELPEEIYDEFVYVLRDWEKNISAADVFHYPSQVYSEEELNKILSARKAVVTFHDLISYTYRDYFKSEEEFEKYRSLSALTLSLSDLILVVSEFTRAEITRYFAFCQEKIKVTKLAIAEKFIQDIHASKKDLFLRKFNLQPGYLLFIGTDYPHKNLARLLKCYENVSEQIGQRKLVVAGVNYFSRLQEELEELKQRLAGKVTFIGHIDEEFIVELYRNAHALIFPSLYEGFGLPPLEAMAVGVPVAASNAASIPEVVADAALLFNGLDERDICRALIKIVNDQYLRAELIKKGFQRIRDFDWQNTAFETILCYYQAHRQKINQRKKEAVLQHEKSIMVNKPLILFVSHVSIVKPSAGNELRIFNLVRFLKSSGYRIAYIYAPLERKLLPPGEETEMFKIVDFFQQINPETVKLQEQQRSKLLDLLARTQEAELSVLKDVEDHYCPLELMAVVTETVAKLKPSIVVAEYVFMSRILKLVGEDALKVIDLHDKFSDKFTKVVNYGVNDLTLSEEEEAAFLNRADLLIAIQEQERQKFALLCKKPLIITAGVDFGLRVAPVAISDQKRILIIASDNKLNIFSIEKFIEDVWSRVKIKLPDYKLRIAGRVCQHLKLREDETVELAGLVEEVSNEYWQATFVINPVIIGTGLKIKSLEALAHGKALLSTPAGVEGLPEMNNELFLVAADQKEFCEKIVSLCKDNNLRIRLEKRAKDFVQNDLNAKFVYRDLTAAFNLFLKAKKI